MYNVPPHQYLPLEKQIDAHPSSIVAGISVSNFDCDSVWQGDASSEDMEIA